MDVMSRVWLDETCQAMPDILVDITYVSDNDEIVEEKHTSI